jgi:hypothetical protein
MVDKAGFDTFPQLLTNHAKPFPGTPNTHPSTHCFGTNDPIAHLAARRLPSEHTRRQDVLHQRSQQPERRLFVAAAPGGFTGGEGAPSSLGLGWS